MDIDAMLREHTKADLRLTTLWVLATLGVCAITFVETLTAVNTAWEKTAIQHGAGHYDPVTAKFVWNNPKVEAK